MAQENVGSWSDADLADENSRKSVDVARLALGPGWVMLELRLMQGTQHPAVAFCNPAARTAFLAVVSLETRKVLWQTQSFPCAGAVRLEVGADGQHVFAAFVAEKTVRVFRAASGQEARAPWTEQAVLHMLPDPDGKSVLCVTEQYGLQRLSVSCAAPYVLRGPPLARDVYLVSVDVARGGVAFCARGTPQSVWFFRSGLASPDLLTEERQVTVPAPVVCLCWAADGEQLLCGLEDGSIWVFLAGGVGEPTVLRGHTAPVRALAPTAGGAAVSVGMDRVIRVWNLATWPIATNSIFSKERLIGVPRLAVSGAAIAMYDESGRVARLRTDRPARRWIPPAVAAILKQSQLVVQNVERFVDGLEVEGDFPNNTWWPTWEKVYLFLDSGRPDRRILRDMSNGEPMFRLPGADYWKTLKQRQFPVLAVVRGSGGALFWRLLWDPSRPRPCDRLVLWKPCVPADADRFTAAAVARMRSKLLPAPKVAALHE